MVAKKKSEKKSNTKQDSKHPQPADVGKRMPKKAYEKELERLQEELVRVQEWVKATEARVVVVFEGRDAAGKGGVIKRITERVSPRVFRVVALPTPTEREKSQWFGQRYVPHLPAAGEVVIFDRSWYNRAGVEKVMGFCTDLEYNRFLEICPAFEKEIVTDGIRLLKYWLTVDYEQQRLRFQSRIDEPRKHWKLSPMDLESPRRWYEYSRARDAMLDATDTSWAPWNIVRSNDKRRARLNCISHFLSQIPYEPIPWDEPKMPQRSHKGAYDDVAALEGRNFIPEIF